MKPVDYIHGRAASYPPTNVDTDQIIPARFLYIDRRAGYERTFFHDLRLDALGVERPDFVFNLPEYRAPKILIAGPNFACGSSREQAVWAVLDYGIECVIAPSFSDIFRANAVENGLLTVTLAAAAVQELHDAVRGAAPCDMTVELNAQRIIGPDQRRYAFDFDRSAKHMLLNGESRIDATLTRRSEIDAFEREYVQRFPWIANGRGR